MCTLARKVIAGIYKIRNKLNGKIYIGQSKDILRRFRYYYWGATTNSVYAARYQSITEAIREYGYENFEFSIIASGPQYNDPNTRTTSEMWYIKKYKSNDPNIGYNEDIGGDIGVLAPRAQSFLERLHRATPVFLYNTENQELLLYMMGAKAVADDFGCDKAITSHSVNRGDVFSQKYYIIPARYNDRYAIVKRRESKLEDIRNRENVQPKNIKRAENSFERFMSVVKYIDSVAHEFGYSCETN